MTFQPRWLSSTLQASTRRLSTTVNDLVTMCVGAASQHILRMSFVLEDEAKSFDTEVVDFWSQLIQRDASSPLFHLPLKLAGLDVGSAEQHHAAAPWRAWQTVLLPHPFCLHATTPRNFPNFPSYNPHSHDESTLPSFLLKPFGPAIRTKTTPQNTCLIHPTTTPQTSSPHPRQCTHQQGHTHLQTSLHAGAHLQQPNSEAHEAEDRPPIPRHSHCLPQQKRNGHMCEPVDACCRYGGGVDRWHAAVARSLADVIQTRTAPPRFALSKPFQASPEM